jgi:PqqD family protein of HPr-rel-A system
MVDALTKTAEHPLLRWKVTAPTLLCWAQFGDKWAIYHRPSGKTHFVSAGAARLLRELLLHPLTVNEVLPALLAAASTTEQEEINATTGELLLRLEELGLVECR